MNRPVLRIPKSFLGAWQAPSPPRHVWHFLQAFVLFSRRSHHTLAAQLERHARVAPGRPFLLFGDQSFSYGQANALVNQHAHAYAAIGVGKGDVVALLMENRPQYVWHFFGLLKLGAVASLINTHVTAASVLSALGVCAPRHIIIGSELWPRLAAARAELGERFPGAVELDVDPEQPCPLDWPSFATRLRQAPRTNPVQTRRQTLEDRAAFIYTSGTTGLPKAAIVRHERFYRAGRLWASVAMRYREGDVAYTCLPLYHSNSIMLAVGSVVTAGVTLALGRKFSLASFWDEVRRHRATSFFYVGELCRYLVNAAPSSHDRAHGVRTISGNGMRGEVWESFVRRFGVQRVAEFYGATEGNCITINVDNAVGSCGPLLTGMALVRWDEAAQAAVRDARGFLVRARAGELGLLLCRIRRDRRFDGYTDRAASERKIVRDAFEVGDAWFDTGDLLRLGAMRRLYFVDRLGDTFRWKGENVATSEVEAQLSRWEPVQLCTVYGVTLPGTEGRAGMATLVMRNDATFDAAAFAAHVQASLPAYARPMFVRIANALETTSTFKFSKLELQRQGYDPAAIADPIYMWHPERQQYVALDAALHSLIRDKRLRV